MSSDKVTAVTSTPLATNSTIVLAAIEGIGDPDSAVLSEMTTESRVRLAWQHFRLHEMELARQRKSEARQGASKHGNSSGLPVTSKRGKSSRYIAERVGMKQTSFQHAQLVVEFADQLKARGQNTEASRLLYLLNSVSVRAAKKERDRLIRLTEDEDAIQREVTQNL